MFIRIVINAITSLYADVILFFNNEAFDPAYNNKVVMWYNFRNNEAREYLAQLVQCDNQQPNYSIKPFE
jgi:hypothetical protein